MSNQDIITVIAKLVEVDMNSKTEEIIKNIVGTTGREKFTFEELNLAFQCIKISTVYSTQMILEILRELNLIELNRYESQNYDYLEKKIEFLSTHRVIKSQKNEE